RDLLALRQVLHLERIGAHGAAVTLDLDEFLQRAFGQLVAHFDGHGLQRPFSMARLAMPSTSDGARSLSQRPILPRAVMITSRSRRSMARTIRRAHTSTGMTSPSFTGVTIAGFPSGPAAFSRIPVATKPG